MELFTYLDLSSRLAMATSLREILFKAGLSEYSNSRECVLFQLLVDHLDIVIYNETEK